MGKSRYDDRRDPLDEFLLQTWHAVAEMEKNLPKRRYFRTVVFGSARLKAHTAAYQDAMCFAKKLAQRHIDIVTGGGPGIMEAANRGATLAQKQGGKGRSFGLRIKLPFEEEPSKFLRWQWEHQNFHTRLHHFSWAGDAFVCYSGGVGTFAELALILQLLQVEHLDPRTPLICVGAMWQRIMEVAYEEWMKEGTVSERDLRRITFVDKGHKAIPLILNAKRQFYADSARLKAA